MDMAMLPPMAPPPTRPLRIRAEVYPPEGSRDLKVKPIQRFFVTIPRQATLRDFCDKAIEQFYDNYQQDLNIKRCQDSDGFDLSLRDNIGDLFDDRSLIRIIQGTSSTRDSVPPESGLRPQNHIDGSLKRSWGRRLSDAIAEETEATLDSTMTSKRPKFYHAHQDYPLQSREHGVEEENEEAVNGTVPDSQRSPILDLRRGSAQNQESTTEADLHFHRNAAPNLNGSQKSPEIGRRSVSTTVTTPIAMNAMSQSNGTSPSRASKSTPRSVSHPKVNLQFGPKPNRNEMIETDDVGTNHTNGTGKHRADTGLSKPPQRKVAPSLQPSALPRETITAGSPSLSNRGVVDSSDSDDEDNTQAQKKSAAQATKAASGKSTTAQSTSTGHKNNQKTSPVPSPNMAQSRKSPKQAAKPTQQTRRKSDASEKQSPKKPTAKEAATVSSSGANITSSQADGRVLPEMQSKATTTPQRATTPSANQRGKSESRILPPNLPHQKSEHIPSITPAKSIASKGSKVAEAVDDSAKSVPPSSLPSIATPTPVAEKRKARPSKDTITPVSVLKHSAQTSKPDVSLEAQMPLPTKLKRSVSFVDERPSSIQSSTKSTASIGEVPSNLTYNAVTLGQSTANPILPSQASSAIKLIQSQAAPSVKETKVYPPGYGPDSSKPETPSTGTQDHAPLVASTKSDAKTPMQRVIKTPTKKTPISTVKNQQSGVSKPTTPSVSKSEPRNQTTAYKKGDSDSSSESGSDSDSDVSSSESDDEKGAPLTSRQSSNAGNTTGRASESPSRDSHSPVRFTQRGERKPSISVGEISISSDSDDTSSEEDTSSAEASSDGSDERDAMDVDEKEKVVPPKQALKKQREEDSDVQEEVNDQLQQTQQSSAGKVDDKATEKSHTPTAQTTDKSTPSSSTSSTTRAFPGLSSLIAFKHQLHRLNQQDPPSANRTVNGLSRPATKASKKDEVSSDDDSESDSNSDGSSSSSESETDNLPPSTQIPKASNAIAESDSESDSDDDSSESDATTPPPKARTGSKSIKPAKTVATKQPSTKGGRAGADMKKAKKKIGVNFTALANQFSQV